MIEDSVGECEPERPGECRVCLGEHDEDIHTATMNVREWFRCQVVKNFEEEVPDEACVA